MGLLGFFGNVFIILGLYGIGSSKPNRNWFIFSFVGETLYILRSYVAHDWNLLFICTIFLLMAVRGFINWGKTSASQAKAA